jgi:uncharacterized protein
MRFNWTFTGLIVATTAGALLIVGRAYIENLRERDRVPSVDDGTALLDARERARIAEYHAALLAAHDIDYRVLSTDAGDDLQRTAHEYFARARVGAASASGRGLLLVVDAADDSVRLEVSTSLEGVYTDAFVAYVQNRQMAPFFAAGRVADGILATTELIVGRAQDAAAGEEYAPTMPASSMGGGASAAAAVGTAGDPSEEYKRQTQHVDVAGQDPLRVVETYHERMARRDARSDLALYSRDTIAMLRNWVVTPAQMDTVVKTYRGCSVDGVRFRADAAVVRYRVDERRCAPYFLRREDGTWRLDLATSSSAIRFNHENQWRFALPLPADYGFAFEDWRLDGNGFPYTRSGPEQPP